MNLKSSSAALLMSVVTLLPFARGLAAGHAFYLRDLSLQFFPVRIYSLEGLRQGELRYWNPYTHEGTPQALPPIGYLGDVPAVASPSESTLSLLLALHTPLAALSLFALAREAGACTLGAVAGGLLYALGGFALSSLNLYVYAQALAWAPLVVRGLMRAAAGTRHDVAKAALPLGVAATTTGAEFVAQAMLAGLILAAPTTRRAIGRVASSVALGLSLAAFVLLPLRELVQGSARHAGFPTEVVLAHSVHPVTLLQTVVAGLYGDPANLVETFWGQNFFPRGFPYFLSLYLGGPALILAFLGLRERLRLGTRAAVLGAIGLLVALGRYAGLEPIVELFDFVRQFRFPSKAFFMVHLAVSLLAALGVHALTATAASAPWRRLTRAAGIATLGLLVFSGVTGIPSALRGTLLVGFFPPELDVPARIAAARAISGDAAVAGALAALVAVLGWAAGRGRITSRLAAALLAGLLAADLLRAGAGLNPMVSPAFYRLSDAAERMAEEVRSGGGRLFVLDPSYSPAYYAARTLRGRRHEAWSFAILQETFVPDCNLRPRVPTALSVDRTMLVAEDRILQPEDADPGALPRLLNRLRAAAVTHVLSLEPLTSPALRLVQTGDPERLAPLVTRLYRLDGSPQRAELTGAGQVLSLLISADTVDATIEAKAADRLVLRDPLARGWSALVDDIPQPVLSHEGRYRAVEVPGGRHVVRFQYGAPGLVAGVAISTMSAAIVAALLAFRRRSPS